MKTVTGVWIDHRKAIIVTLSDYGVQTQEVLSNVEKHPGRVNGDHSAPAFESQLMQADDKRQREFTHHLDAFYEAVLDVIREAESVLIFGPGEAKGEMKKKLEKKNHRDRVLVVETADKMTDHRITEKVRHFYELENAR